jgi:hypothetical protein
MPPSCLACQSTAVTQIAMTMTAGQVVQMTSCHRCEHKTWREEGEPVPLDRVLSLAAKKKNSA